MEWKNDTPAGTLMANVRAIRETVDKNHADLTNLDYAASGHTGFASGEDIARLEREVNNTGETIDVLRQDIAVLGQTKGETLGLSGSEIQLLSGENTPVSSLNISPAYAAFTTGSGSFVSVSHAGKSGTFRYSKTGNVVTLRGNCITNSTDNYAVYTGLPYLSRYYSEVVQQYGVMPSKTIRIWTGNTDNDTSTSLYIQCIPSESGDRKEFLENGTVTFTITYLTV